jgi:hypothetical protein
MPDRIRHPEDFGKKPDSVNVAPDGLKSSISCLIFLRMTKNAVFNLLQKN